MDPALKELMKGSGEDEVEAIVQLGPDGDIPPGVRVVARFGEIATIRLPRQRIAETWADESVVSLKAARPFGLDPDPLPAASTDGEVEDLEEETDDRRRPEGIDATGRGVVVAVLDWGFDFAHPNFRNRDGSTRALALWDQSAPGRGPEPYGYGRVYTREEIDRALRHDEPYRALGYHPAAGDPTGKGAHGTHVLDIAAGNGRAEGAPLGIAPEADLLFVHLATRGGIGDQASLGNSVTLLEGLDWVARMAGGRPWVVNMSVGRHGGPHNGLTLVERGLDALLAAGPGRAVVQSTGNYYTARVHASGYLRPGQEHVLHWCTDQADLTPNELEVWYPGRDVFGLEVRSPEGETRARVPLGGQAVIEIGGREVGRAYHRAKDPGCGDNHIDIFLDPQAPAGCWRVVLSGEDVTDGRFHAWVERDAGCPTCQSRLEPGDADPTTTLGTIANGFRSITVGAYDAHSGDRPLGPFSSCGPTRDGRMKPDLLAPGVRVLAARSASLALGSDTPLLTRYSGTSMAAPHVTGTVALMFEVAARPLTIQETRKLLLSTAREARLEDEPAMRLGSGYLDIERAVEAARGFATPPHAESETPEIFETEPEQAMEQEPAIPTCGCRSHETFDEPHECRCHEAENVPAEDVETSQPVYADIGSPTSSGRLQPAEDAEASYWVDQTDWVDQTGAGEALPQEPWMPEPPALRGDVPTVEDCPCRRERTGTSLPPPAEDEDLIGLADGAVRAGGSLLDPVLGRVESLGSWWEAALSPSTLFDSIVGGGAPRKHFVPSFEILALPGETPLEPMEPGDLLVRRGMGEGGLGHVAMVASGETWEAGELAGAGLRSEAPRPGRFVQVVEGGWQPHGLSDGFARRALDETGRLPFDQILLRPRAARPAYGEGGEASLQAPAETWEETAGGASPAQPDLSVPCPPPPTRLDQFVFDRSTLTADHLTAVRVLARAIVDSQDTATPAHTVCLVGHTDGTGNDAYNVGLGNRRAAAVQAELTRQIDLLRPGLSALLTFRPSSAGKSAPVASNATAAGQALNRRVEVFVNRRWTTSCLRPPVAPPADDPAGLNLHPVGNRDFNGGTVTVLGQSLQLRGNVFYPGDRAGRDVPFKSGLAAAPIVFLLHGNHPTLHHPTDRNNEVCPSHAGPGFVTIQNFRGYEYLQTQLARMGIISVSVDCNATNCVGLSPENIRLRAGLLLAALRHFRGLHTGAGTPFSGKIDFSHVAFFGHSRGAEAVLVAAEGLPTASGLAGVTLRGVLSLAPTDAHASSGRPNGFPFLTVLPAGDGDVIPNFGARFYDQAVPSPFKCQLYIDRTNHNFFNTEWPRNEGRGAIFVEAVHRRLLSVYGCAFFRHVLLGHATLRFLRGDALPPGVPSGDVHISFEQTGALTVADHENRNVLVNALGQPSGPSPGLTADEFDFKQGGHNFNGTFYGNTGGLVAQSSSPSAQFRSQLAAPRDLTGKEIWIRAAEVYNPIGVPAGATGYLIGLEDTSGRIALADSDDAGGLPRPFDRKADDVRINRADFTKTMLTTQRFPSGCFAGLRFDVTHVRAVVIRLSRGDCRAIAFDQLQIV
ncbi:MAG TPA: S8 family serine peptidase [Thermoanaerobaculia bacterium]